MPVRVDRRACGVVTVYAPDIIRRNRRIMGSVTVSVRVSLRLLVASVLTAPLVASTLVAPAQAKPKAPVLRASESIRVDMGATKYGPIGRWGIDLKQAGRAEKYADDPALVDRTFRDGRFTWVRISFRADARGVNDDGSLKTEGNYLEKTIGAVRAIRAKYPQVQVWASRNTITDCDDWPRDKGPTACLDFHESLKEGGVEDGALDPAAYGRLAAEYVNHMRGLEDPIPVHVMGLDNEPHNNEGNLTPARFLQAAEAMEAELDGALPQLMMNCANNPSMPWLREASESPEVLEKLTYASMHSHPKRLDKLRSKAPMFANLARASGLIPVNSELHWDHRPPRPIDEATRSVRATLDQLSWGYRGFSIWAHKPDHDTTLDVHRTEAQITNAMVASTNGGRWIRTADWDGGSITEGVRTQAFRRGLTIHLWIVNDTDKSHPGRALDVRGPAGGARKVPRSVSLVRWAAKGQQVVRSTGRGTRRQRVVRVNVSPQSVMMVRIRI